MSTFAVTRPEAPFAMAMAVGAALGAAGATLAGLQAAQDGLPDLSAVTADLGLAAHGTPAAVTPVAPAAAAPAAAAPSPEIGKARALAEHDATVERAVAKFESVIGTTRYEQYCERAVENAFGHQGRYASAIDDWHAREQHRDWQHAPRGALVFYDTSSNGHVALSLGDGRVVSSSAHHRVGVVPVGYFQHPLGWAPAPY